MDGLHPRLRRERLTLDLMIDLYCHHQHTQNGLCRDCSTLKDYAHVKLEQCRYQENKPTCSNCPIHCYRKSKQRQIKEVMRYSGPRMMLKHPRLAVMHLLDGRKKVDDNLK